MGFRAGHTDGLAVQAFVEAFQGVDARVAFVRRRGLFVEQAVALVVARGEARVVARGVVGWWGERVA